MTETDAIELVRSIDKNTGSRTGPIIQLQGGGAKKKSVTAKGAKKGAGKQPAPEDTPMKHAFPASTSKAAGARSM
jgi:hypothetical protein